LHDSASTKTEKTKNILFIRLLILELVKI